MTVTTFSLFTLFPLATNWHGISVFLMMRHGIHWATKKQPSSISTSLETYDGPVSRRPALLYTIRSIGTRQSRRHRAFWSVIVLHRVFFILFNSALGFFLSGFRRFPRSSPSRFQHDLSPSRDMHCAKYIGQSSSQDMAERSGYRDGRWLGCFCERFGLYPALCTTARATVMHRNYSLLGGRSLLGRPGHRLPPTPQNNDHHADNIIIVLSSWRWIRVS